MRQETAAGIIMIVIGLFLAFAPDVIWKISLHKRKMPTMFASLIRILSGMMFGV